MRLKDLSDLEISTIVWAVVAIVWTVGTFLVFFAGCAAPERPSCDVKARLGPLLVVVPVPCMAPPPPVFVPTWPPPDVVGNVLMHSSTQEALRDALVEYRRYIDEQYARCVDSALGRDSVFFGAPKDPDALVPL